MDDMIEMIKAVEAKIDSLQKGDPRIAELETKLAALQDDFRRAAQKPAAAEKADASALQSCVVGFHAAVSHGSGQVFPFFHGTFAFLL